MSAILNSLRNLASSSKATSGDSEARFSLAPDGEGGSGEGGYSEWLHAMRLVARLPAGVPHHFRKKLWLTLAERHLNARGIDWSAAERACFRGTAHPDDTELGAQIIKDLHRTGCSLFCGTEGRENQAMLRRVLLAYARWNKEVGYCQGFNMLAAIILEVMDKSEADSVKVMIYLVEAVLPEGYFADDLRGLSADMAAFRDLLKIRLPRLAQHMDNLQRLSDGGGVEPPLPDVFTMQWFLTLYATWLPRESLLRVWDLILLDGNEILLLTALAIWDLLQDRILSARSADEYYSCMGNGASAVWEAGDGLVARVVALGTAPELPRLRNLHRYRVTPPAPPAQAPSVYHPPLHSAMQTMTKRGLRLFYSEDEGDSSDEGNKLALSTVLPRRDEKLGAGDRLSLDIGALKRQYARLRERQRQAHVILAAACARHAAVGVPTSPTSLTVNNLLLGKSAIVSSRGRRLGPPPGAVPPSRHTSIKSESRLRSHTNDTISWQEEKNRKSLSRRNSVKWKDIKKEKANDRIRKASIDLDETGDGIIVSEREANEMIASLRSRSSSETSSYSSRTGSSTDTSLCDENEKDSDSELEMPRENSMNKITDLKEQTKLSSPVIYQEMQNKENLIQETVPDISTPKNLTEYIDSDAGKPLRTYLEQFTVHEPIGNISLEKYTSCSPCNVDTFNESTRQANLIHSPLKENTIQLETIRANEPIVTKNTLISNIDLKLYKDLSPIKLSPCNLPLTYGCEEHNLSPIYKELSPIKPASKSLDIIDSLTKYPNFVPDIDLTERSTSDIESPLRSPGAESIVVSEDEPPIPLKIDKYFEYSPEFFGARITATDSDNTDIPNRRAPKRLSRLVKKPDSLTLHSNRIFESSYNAEIERASSLPHSISNRLTLTTNEDLIPKHTTGVDSIKQDNTNYTSQNEALASHDFSPIKPYPDIDSPKDYILRSGRKNSERALQIIQENSKILNRILTKQNMSDSKNLPLSTSLESPKEDNLDHFSNAVKEKCMSKITTNCLLKESTSDSIIGYQKRYETQTIIREKNDFQRVRPISLDDPLLLETKEIKTDIHISEVRSPSLSKNNFDVVYGWENKGFLAKYSDQYKKSEEKLELLLNENKQLSSSKEASEELPVTTQYSESKDCTYDNRFMSDDYKYQYPGKYNDFVLSKASDICSKSLELSPNVLEQSKGDYSQASDFAHMVTSSISFTYEPSVEDDSPTGAKSNSSDTLCQITSLDQVSTPISPKIFPKETSLLPKELSDKNDPSKMDSDDTCSTITSLIETDTMSSISYPRSSSTGSHYPFPTRPVLRVPKELGVRLGMYPRDSLSSPQK